MGEGRGTGRGPGARDLIPVLQRAPTPCQRCCRSGIPHPGPVPGAGAGSCRRSARYRFGYPAAALGFPGNRCQTAVLVCAPP